MQGTAEKISTDLKDGAKEMASKAGNAASHGIQKAADTVDSIRERGEGLMEEARAYLERFPPQAILVGLGAGLLVGWLIARR